MSQTKSAAWNLVQTAKTTIPHMPMIPATVLTLYHDTYCCQRKTVHGIHELVSRTARGVRSAVKRRQPRYWYIRQGDKLQSSRPSSHIHIAVKKQSTEFTRYGKLQGLQWRQAAVVPPQLTHSCSLSCLVTQTSFAKQPRILNQVFVKRLLVAA